MPQASDSTVFNGALGNAAEVYTDRTSYLMGRDGCSKASFLSNISSSLCSYDLMCRCWHSEPKLRPSFGALKLQLEMILARLSLLSSSQDPLYVNIGKSHGVSWNDPSTDSPFGTLDNDLSVSGAAAIAVTSDYRYIVSPSCLGNDAESERHPDASEEEASSLLYDLEMGPKEC